MATNAFRGNTQAFGELGSIAALDFKYENALLGAETVKTADIAINPVERFFCLNTGPVSYQVDNLVFVQRKKCFCTVIQLYLGNAQFRRPERARDDGHRDNGGYKHGRDF